ncbi:alginate export family protein [Phenylobacterium immobile]|uniref:alginate export family protein n=1 Tax=Phenylobacterium immobile TaxID=21 RepID=UPI000AC1B23F|nr:alginate export family protein [Phenylobacterium immobile]
MGARPKERQRGLVRLGRLFAILLALLLPAAAAVARTCDQLTADGNVRARYEIVENQPRPEFRDNETVYSLRTALFAECVKGAWRVGGELVDSRAFNVKMGSAISSNDVNILEPVQAYVGYDFAVGEKAKAALQLGRFQISPTQQRRQLTVDNYRNTPNGFTGLRAGLGFKSGETVTLIAVAPQLRLPADDVSLRDLRRGLDRESLHLLFWGVIANGLDVGHGHRLELSYFGLRETDAASRPSRDRRLATFTARLYRPSLGPGWDYEAEVLRQVGRISADMEPGAPRMDVLAGFARANLGYTFDNPWNPRLAVEFDWGSGDGPGPKYGRFDALYTVRRPRLAPFGILASSSRANVVAPGVRLEFEPNSRTDVLLNYHRFYLDSPTDLFASTRVQDPLGQSGRLAGDQFDSRVRYWLRPNKLRFEADYVLLAKGRFLREAPNTGSTGDTHYLSMNLTYSF